MSFRNWVFVAALGLTIATSGQAQGQTDGSGNGPADQEQPSQHLPRPFPVQIIEDDEAAEARDRREEEARQHEIDDLAAQQGMNIATQAMNEATQRMAIYALISMVLAAIGTGLLFWTLALTRKTNKAAVEAANEAVKANKIMRAEMRPWLDFEVVEWGRVQVIFHEGKRYTLFGAPKVEITNKGKSPATKVYYQTRVYEGTSFDDERALSEALDAAEDADLSMAKMAFPNQSILWERVYGFGKIHAAGESGNPNAMNNWWFACLLTYAFGDDTCYTFKVFSVGVPDDTHLIDDSGNKFFDITGVSHTVWGDRFH